MGTRGPDSGRPQGAPTSAVGGTPPSADAAARASIANDLDTTILVEAAAGTGKTTSLVTRMVNLVRTGRAAAGEIAAITFTRKAGAQLRERFQEALEEATEGDGADRAQEALGNLDRSFLGTTHAFCARLLRERPVEAGLDPEFRELDEQEAKLAAAEFWSRWWEQRAAADDPVVVEARQAGLNGAKLAAVFQKVLYHPDVRLAWTRMEQPDLKGAVRRLNELLDAMEPHVPGPRTDGKASTFEDMIRNLLRRRRSMDATAVADQLLFVREANHASAKPIQKLWSDARQAKQYGVEFSAFVTTTARPTLERWREYVHAVALSIVEPAATAYERERRELGTVTFEDLLVRARDLLRDKPEVRRYFQSRWKYVLVDEFQDTDPVQAEILFYLTGVETEEMRWRELTPRPGSLFIVGDPKQSIYRFRRADITTYLTVRERIEATGGKVLILSTNFRSTPDICAFVNESFAALFAPSEVEAKRQAAHVDLVAHRPAAAGGVFKLPTFGQSESQDNDGVCEREAACVAGWIRRAVAEKTTVVDRGVEREARYEDFLLVSWQRPRLAAYARALESAGVPYEITGGKAFQESEELRRLLPLLRAILDPDDAIPLAAFLRGPLCGADDGALYRFRKLGGRLNLWKDPPEGTDARIIAGLALAKEAAREAESLPAAAVIARLVDRLGLAALAGAKERGATRAGNLALALTYARKASGEGSSLADVVELLEALREETSEIEELNIDPAARDAVRLMNLHQAKGLEAPFVFLIDPSKPYVFPPEIVVDRQGEESVGHLIIRGKAYPKAKFEEVFGQPAGWDALEQTEAQFKAAEVMRLLYVAATRAQQFLVIGVRRIASGTETGAWGPLGAWVENELPLGGAMEPIAPAARAEADAAEARRAIDARFAFAREASYSVLPITKVAHEDQRELVRAEEGLGRGTSWGRVMHRLFEAMLGGTAGGTADGGTVDGGTADGGTVDGGTADGGTAARCAALRGDVDVALLAANLLKDEEREPAELDEVLRTVEAVRSSPLWTRVLASDEVMVEVPFAIDVNARELELSGPERTLLHGTVDLLFREGDTWNIVDYKTDSTAAGRLEALVAHYAPQVKHYAAFWSRITGAPSRAGLFFVDGCVEAWVDTPT